MRSVCLLVVGFMSLLCYPPHPSLTQAPERRESLDDLKKYTYLLIGVQRPRRPNGRRREPTNSSGFFVHRNGKLYLVSAFHVFTGYDLFRRKIRPDHPDSLQVWFTDAQNNYTYIGIPVPKYEHLKRISPYKRVDLELMDVTEYFTNIPVNAIDRMLPDFDAGPDLMQIGDTVVCYGFHKDGLHKIPPQIGDDPVLPAGHRSRIIDNPDKKATQVFYPYNMVAPIFEDGFSGAPVFRIRNEKTDSVVYEFAGVQSSNQDSDRYGVIVQFIQLGNMLRKVQSK